MFIYTRADLKSHLNAGIFGKIGMLRDEDETVNRAVRQAMTDFDFRSMRRRTALAPNLFNDITDYASPTDLDAYKIIDIPAQAKRQDGEFFLVPTQEFVTKRRRGMIAIRDYNGVRALQVSSNVDDHSILVAELDSLVSGSSNNSNWIAFGDAVNLAADNDDFLKGSGSIKWGISGAAGTTAGIQHPSINPIDISDFFGGTSAFFVWTRITDITNITNYKLRFGSDAATYYEKTVTAQADGTALVNGWNLLKFDITNLTLTGVPVDTNIKFFAIFMTKTSGKVSETDYKFDWLVLKRGVIHNVDYYSKYGWQSAAGAWKENSTDEGDFVVADKDEFEIILEKAIQIAAREVREFDLAKDAERQYKEKGYAYQQRNPSEAKIMTSEYYNYGETTPYGSD